MIDPEADDLAIVRYALIEEALKSAVKRYWPQLPQNEVEVLVERSIWTLAPDGSLSIQLFPLNTHIDVNLKVVDH